MVGLSAAEATALLNAAGPSAIGHFTRAYHFEKDPIDARRVNLYKGTSQAAALDWDKVHPQVSPANPATAGKLPAKYGSLREVFYQHRAKQLLATFGVQSLDIGDRRRRGRPARRRSGRPRRSATCCSAATSTRSSRR